jgi:hypothetical protein
MDVEDLEANNDLPSEYKRTLAENCVEYFIFDIPTHAENKSRLSQLEQVRKAATAFALDLTADYIWQREGFQLDIKHDQGTVAASTEPRLAPPSANE